MSKYSRDFYNIVASGWEKEKEDPNYVVINSGMISELRATIRDLGKVMEKSKSFPEKLVLSINEVLPTFLTYTITIIGSFLGFSTAMYMAFCFWGTTRGHILKYISTAGKDIAEKNLNRARKLLELNGEEVVSKSLIKNYDDHSARLGRIGNLVGEIDNSFQALLNSIENELTDESGKSAALPLKPFVNKLKEYIKMRKDSTGGGYLGFTRYLDSVMNNIAYVTDDKTYKSTFSDNVLFPSKEEKAAMGLINKDILKDLLNKGKTLKMNLDNTQGWLPAFQEIKKSSSFNRTCQVKLAMEKSSAVGEGVRSTMEALPGYYKYLKEVVFGAPLDVPDDIAKLFVAYTGKAGTLIFDGFMSMNVLLSLVGMIGVIRWLIKTLSPVDKQMIRQNDPRNRDVDDSLRRAEQIMSSIINDAKRSNPTLNRDSRLDIDTERINFPRL